MYGVNRRKELIAALVIAVAVAILHGEALRGWWMNDDPQVLLHAKRTSTAGLFTEPDTWRTLSTSNYTPLVTMSFELDLQLFGLDPTHFYVHHLVSLAILAWLFHLLARDHFGSRAALIGTLFVLLVPVTFIVARSLMLRHYIEGGALACGALLVWSRQRNLRGSFAAAALYFAAMLAKEVYAPLPLLLLASEHASDGSWRSRWKGVAVRLMPPAAAAIGYIALRTWMLGSAGGYEAPEAGAMLRLPIDVARAALVRGAGVSGWSILLAASFFVVGAARKWGGGRAVVPLILAAVFAFLPLVAVAGAIESRYAFVPALLVAFAGAAFAATGRIATLIAIVALVAIAIAGFTASEDFERWALQQQKEGRYIFEQPSGAPPLIGESPGWYLAGLRDLDENGSPRFVLSRDALILGAVEPERVLHATPEGMKRLDAAVVAEIEAAQRLRDPSLAIDAVFERNGSTLSWAIEPECDCDFRFITLPEYDDHPIPKSGARRVPRPAEEQRVIVRRVERDGRWNVTSPIVLPR